MKKLTLEKLHKDIDMVLNPPLKSNNNVALQRLLNMVRNKRGKISGR